MVSGYRQIKYSQLNSDVFTEIVHDFSIIKPSSGSHFVKFIPDINSTVKWATAKNGKRYEGKIIFHFKEKEFNSPNIISRSLIWDLGSQKSVSTSGGAEMEFTLSNNYFYELLKYNVPYSDIQKENNQVRQNKKNLKHQTYP